MQRRRRARRPTPRRSRPTPGRRPARSGSRRRCGPSPTSGGRGPRRGQPTRARRRRRSAAGPDPARPRCRRAGSSVSSNVMRMPAAAAASISAAPIAFWSSYGTPPDVVVEVVELADARDAGERHLAEHRRGEPVVRLRRQALGRRVHLLAPRPERADADLGGTAQHPVERVTVGVGQARQREAGKAGRRRRRLADAGRTAVMRSPSTSIEHAGRDGVAAEPRQLAPVARRHEPTRRTNSVIRVTNASRWWRSNCSHVVSERVSWTRSRNSIPSRWSHSCWYVPAVRPRLISSCSTPSRSSERTRMLTEPHHVAAEVRDRQAALVDLDLLVVDGLDHRVDDDRQRDRRLVRVARVVVDLDRRDAHRHADLRGGDPGAVGGVHRVDQVVDQRLHLLTGELVGRHLPRPLAEQRVPDGEDLADGHVSRAPASGSAHPARRPPRSPGRSRRRRGASRRCRDRR